MNTKLTLKLDKDIIEQAKMYAHHSHQSLSALVERYFRYLLDQKQPRSRTVISPTVKELSGIIHLDDEWNLQEEYTTYLVEKYHV